MVSAAMATAADQKADADETVDGDCRDQRVAGQRLRLRSLAEHDRDDQRSFDDGDGQSQDQRSERFAEVVRQDFGMDYRCHDNAGQQQAENYGDGQTAREA